MYSISHHKRLKPKKRHKNSGKARGFKDPEYLDHMHHSDKRCVVCNSINIELHHIRNTGQVGRHDNQVVPLCPDHHRGTVSPHGFMVNEFYESYPKHYLLNLATEFYNEYQIIK